LQCICLTATKKITMRRALGAYKPIDFVDKPVPPIKPRRTLQTAKRLIA